MRRQPWLVLWPACIFAQSSVIDHHSDELHLLEANYPHLYDHPYMSPSRRTLLMHHIFTYDELAGAIARVDENVLILANDVTLNGTLTVSHNLSISTSTSGPFALDAQHSQRVFTVLAGGDLLLEDIIIKNAFSESNGGAILVLDGALELVRCTILSSSAAEGGAIFGSRASIRLSESHFLSNHALSGGALLMSDSALFLSACSFRQNYAERDGGALALRASTCRAESCHLEDNAALTGGAIAVGASSHVSTFECHFKKNRATSLSKDGQAQGGALFMSDCEGIIQGGDFVLNSADQGGAIAALSTTLATTTVTFLQNSAQYGGAMTLNLTHLTDDRSRVKMNSADFLGGGIYLLNKAILSATDSIVEDNHPDDVSRAQTSPSSIKDAFKTSGQILTALQSAVKATVTKSIETTQAPDPTIESRFEALVSDPELVESTQIDTQEVPSSIEEPFGDAEERMLAAVETPAPTYATPVPTTELPDYRKLQGGEFDSSSVTDPPTFVTPMPTA